MLNAAFAATGIAAEMIKVGVPPEHFAANAAFSIAAPSSVEWPRSLARSTRSVRA